MTKDDLQKVRFALAHSTPDDGIVSTYSKAIRILDAALAAPEPQPVAAQARYRIIKVDHPFYDPKKGWSIWQETSMRNVKLDMHHVDNAGYETEYRYLYASPVAAPQEDGWTDEDAAYLSDAINADISKDAAKYAFVLRLCAHISGRTVEQVDAQIVKLMSEQPMEKL